MGQGEGQSLVAAAISSFGGGPSGGTPGTIPEEDGDRARSAGGVSEERAIAVAATATAAADRALAMEGEEGMSFRDTTNTMEDDERETLLSLLSGAYSQVRQDRTGAGGGRKLEKSDTDTEGRVE